MIANLTNFFGFIGGMGMFLYGMHIMAEGMQKAAGGRLQKFLGMITNNRLMAVLIGAVITGIIQSSAATTVMVVGFVNGGILTLSQAAGVIMGANIGTTITAWIVSMNQLGDAMILTTPEFYAPLVVGVGALVLVFSMSEKRKMVAEILLGLGLLFLGLKYMSSSINPYTQNPIFSDIFVVLGKNPLLGILAGAVVTAAIQSSSASVGILQTLSMSGIVNMSSAIFITLGQNIGTCITALLSSIGGSRTAKRAAVIHLLFNVIGAIVFGILGFVYFSFDRKMALSSMSSVEISIFHTLFNATMTILLFPFAEVLVKLSGLIVKEDKKLAKAKEDEEEVTLKHLDIRIFSSPALALETVSMEVVHMGEIAFENVNRAIDAVISGSEESVQKVLKAEKTINKIQEILTEYIIKLDNQVLNEHQKLVLNDLFYTVSDIERIGDHAENIVENADIIKKKNLKFSETAINDLKEIASYVCESVSYAIEARKDMSLEAVRKVNKNEDMVDNMEDELREKHIDRLSKGLCQTESGVIFLDIVSNLERISDHATNIAGYVTKEV
jgi:Na/Pi-cotransporter II-like protein